MQDKTDESTVTALVEQFLTARATRKPSPHTLAAYRRDLLSLATLVADDAAYEHGLSENLAALVVKLAPDYSHVLAAATTIVSLVIATWPPLA